jgi:ubiquinone/menaquinone biosynthesis C-methylase UbiE
MSLWGHVFAAGYDAFTSRSEKAGLRARRGTLLAATHGDVLEIGGGTGANLAHYPAGVSLVVTEPEEPMARRLERKLARSGRSARVVRAPAERLPFEDASFDFVVSTLVLCTVTDPDRALAEIRRVLRSGGRLLFMEHVRADDPRAAHWQDRLHGPWLRFGHGCHCNRATLDTIRAARFEIAALERGAIPKAPPIVRPLVVGAAEPASAGGAPIAEHTRRFPVTGELTASQAIEDDRAAR